MEEMTRPLTGDAEAVTRTGEPDAEPLAGEVMLTPANEKTAMNRNIKTDKAFTKRLHLEGILWRLRARI
jgi:hypothetical protein